MIKPNMPHPTYPAAAFTWRGCTGATEASTLGVRAGQPLGARLWDDACDLGFALHSERTGRDVVFTLHRVDRREGEILGWHFRSVDGRIAVVIFND